MKQLNEHEIDFLNQFKSELRKGNLSGLAKELIRYDLSDVHNIVEFLLEKGVPILDEFNTLRTDTISRFDSLTGLHIPGSIKTMSSSSIRFNKSIKTITLEDGIEVIAKYAIVNNPNLEEIVLPNTLKSIGDEAFNNNPKLKEIFIPDSVTKLPRDLFKGCDPNIVVKANYRADKTRRLKCREEEIAWYKEHLKWVKD